MSAPFREAENLIGGAIAEITSALSGLDMVPVSGQVYHLREHLQAAMEYLNRAPDAQALLMRLEGIKELAEVRLKDLTNHNKIVDTLGAILMIASLKP